MTPNNALPPADPEISFIADSMLGTLARKLRMLGLDTEYFPDAEIPELLYRAKAEGRTLLTKSRKLAGSRGISVWLVKGDGYWEEFLSIAGLLSKSVSEYRFLSRCTVCNGSLKEVFGNIVKEKVPPHVLKTRTQFRVCSRCARVYWQGSHGSGMNMDAARMMEKLTE